MRASRTYPAVILVALMMCLTAPPALASPSSAQLREMPPTAWLSVDFPEPSQQPVLQGNGILKILGPGRYSVIFGGYPGRGAAALTTKTPGTSCQFTGITGFPGGTTQLDVLCWAAGLGVDKHAGFMLLYREGPVAGGGDAVRLVSENPTAAQSVPGRQETTVNGAVTVQKATVVRRGLGTYAVHMPGIAADPGDTLPVVHAVAQKQWATRCVAQPPRKTQVKATGGGYAAGTLVTVLCFGDPNEMTDSAFHLIATVGTTTRGNTGAYGWDTEPSRPVGTTTPLTNQWNSAYPVPTVDSQRVRTVHKGVGRYAVRAPGLQPGSSAMVLVSPLGSAADCSAAEFHRVDPPYYAEARIDCYDNFAMPVDTAIAVTILQ